MPKNSIGYITFKNKREALAICDVLLNEKLIACANILSPHTALYTWKSKNVRASEVAAIIKTPARLEKKVARRVSELHSYELPCVVFWKFNAPLTAFHQWIEAQTQ